MKLLMRILWELFKEQSEESIDVLPSCDSVAHRATAVGESNVYRLVQKYDGGVCIP